MGPLAGVLAGAAGGTAFLGTAMAGGQSYLNYDAQMRTNATNERLMNKQMDFQKWMSNTAHQREVEDLKAAGLNPILSAGGNGASTPSGASATMQAPQISLPDIFAYGVSLKQLEQADQRLAIDKANSAAAISKNLTDQDLTKAKTILAQKGMPRAELEGETYKVIRGIINRVKDEVRKAQQPRPSKLDPNNMGGWQGFSPNNQNSLTQP